LEKSFLQTYLEAFNRIQGWFQFDAALMFMAYNQLLARRGIAGHVLEIGVQHGLSAIGIAALRQPGKLFYAIDLFEELQASNISGSGRGDRRLFKQNMEMFYPDTSFMRVIARPSKDLTPNDLGSGFSFCHIDGGHTRQETYADLCLCHALLSPGGLLALDDYFNPEHPGVCEGAVEFMLNHRNALRPLAIGYGKVLFQKLPVAFDLNARFDEAFSGVNCKIVRLWDTPSKVFPPVLRSHFDLNASTSQRFITLGQLGARATFAPECKEIRAQCDETVTLSVVVANTSAEIFPSGERIFGLSYHLLSTSGEVLRHDNARAWFTTPMRPGDTQTVALVVATPPVPGDYQIEIDLVWEQVMWFKDVGNPPALVKLAVF
jgi:hypothetical protein